MARITIIGAGPAGSYAAKELAKQGHDVIVFEDHYECGVPIRCTGILTHASNELIQPQDEFVDTYIEHATIHAPNDNTTEVSFHKPNIIVNRTKYDQSLLQQAQEHGAEIRTGHKYKNARWNNGKVHKIKIEDVNTNQTKYFKTDYLIGADGANSPVAKTNNMYGDREFFIGCQATVQQANNGNIQFYPYIDDFAWAVPESNNALRVGIAARDQPKDRFQQFLNTFDGDITDYQGGPIPIHDPTLQTQKANVFLVGDAATHVKATTGGGIIQSMTAATALAEAINDNPHNPPYERYWKAKMGYDLRTHRLLRRMLTNFTDQDWNDLVNTFNKPKLNNVLKEVDRDHGFKLALKCLKKQPTLLRYATKLFY